MRGKTLLSKFGLEDRNPYLFAFVVVAVTAALRFYLQPFFHGFPPFILLITAVTVSALYGGMGPGLLATALSIGAAWLMFDQTPFLTSTPSSSLEAGLLLFVIVATLKMVAPA